MLKEIFSTIVATIILLIVGYFVVRKIGLNLKPLADLIPSGGKLLEDTGTVLREGPKFLATTIFKGRKNDAGYITADQQRELAQSELAARRSRYGKFGAGVKLAPGFGR